MPRSYIHHLTLSVIACLISLISISEARVYNVNTQKRFEAVKNLKLVPGDKVLLKKGMTFKGMLEINGNGSSNAPVIIGSYSYGARPKIHAGGTNQAGLLLKDPSFVEVSGLEITNTNGTDDDQGELFGIYVNVGGVGIGNRASNAGVTFEGDKTITKNLWTKVYVAGNFIERTGRNCIIARVSKDAIYEHNTLAHSSRYDTGHSIFCFDTSNIKIQYNEAYGNVGDESKDRGGFDADYNCDNTFIQYNYSHDNEWFCGIMKRPNRNITIRYNISENEKKGIYFYGFDKQKDVRNIHIYNNTHFTGKHLKAEIFPEGRTPHDSKFENNIFYFEGKGTWGEKVTGPKTSFHNNLYYGIEPHPSDKSPITMDPKFINPGTAGEQVDWKSFKNFKGYMLKGNSPALNAGAPIRENGGIDFFKKKTGSKLHLPHSW